jgi:Fe-S cluster assembly protein SufD
VAAAESKFLALWNAAHSHGVFVCVPSGVEAKLPVWIAHSAQGVDGANSATLPATVVVLGRNSSLSLVEAYQSAETGPALTSIAASIFQLGDDARLDYSVIQHWGESVAHFATHRARLADNAKLRFFGATLGSRLQKSYWEAILDGHGAEADITGVAFGDHSQHLDHQTLQDHRGLDTRSNLLLKVAVRDKARSVYSGMIDVAKEAVRTDGYVQNRNLILSPTAVADSIPRLQIRANDVKCGHGSTAGHIDEEQRFYLQSRGVERSEADKIIVRGFLDDALSFVRHEGLHGYLAEVLEAEVQGAEPSE